MPHQEIRSDLDSAVERLTLAVASFHEEAQAAISASQEEVGDYLLVQYEPPSDSIVPCLPSPRLQLRWAHSDDGGSTCHYEFVFPLEKGDIRDGGAGHCVVALNRGYSSSPYKLEANGNIRVPWRDGVHAKLDAARFGNPPIYVIDPLGRYNLIEV